MKKHGMRFLSLLLACVMMLACSVTAFADDVPTVPKKYRAPNTWFYESASYDDTIKIPCKGTLTLIADIDEEDVTGMCPQQYALKNIDTGKYANSDGFVKNGVFFTKTLSKGSYEFSTVFEKVGRYKYAFVPAKTALTGAANASSKAISLKWKQVTGVTGYQIQYSTKSSFASRKTVTVSKASTVSRKLTGLAVGKKYYVRIRTYATISGKKCYSAWSAVKSVTIKK